MIWDWKGEKWGNNEPLPRTHKLIYWKMKLVSNKFVKIVYNVSVKLTKVQYLVLMGVIYMLLKTFSDRLGIKVSVITLRIFHTTNISHTYFLHLEYSAHAFIILGSAYVLPMDMGPRVIAIYKSQKKLFLWEEVTRLSYLYSPMPEVSAPAAEVYFILTTNT